MTFQNIRPGTVVWYRTPQGQLHKGKAVRLLCFADHVVIDIGRGRPVVVNEENFVAVGAKITK
jgi:hypothetical protein